MLGDILIRSVKGNYITPEEGSSENNTTIFEDGESMARISALSGAIASKVGLFACKLKFSSDSNGSADAIIGLGADVAITIGFSRASADAKRFYILIATLDGEWFIKSDNEFPADTFLSVVCNFTTDSNIDTTGFHLEVNGVSEPLSVETEWDLTGIEIQWQDIDVAWAVANSTVVTTEYEFIWFSITEFEAGAFFNESGCTENLGADGSTPTGTQPIIYVSGNSSEFGTNKGYGGDFATVSGTPSDGTVTCP